MREECGLVSGASLNPSQTAKMSKIQLDQLIMVLTNHAPWEEVKSYYDVEQPEDLVEMLVNAAKERKDIYAKLKPDLSNLDEMATEAGWSIEKYAALNEETTPKKPKFGAVASSSGTIAIMPPVEQLTRLKFDTIKTIGNVILEREQQTMNLRVHRLSDDFKRWVGAASETVDLVVHQGEVAIFKPHENIFERVDGKEFPTSIAVQPPAAVAAAAVGRQNTDNRPQDVSIVQQRSLETEFNRQAHQEAEEQRRLAAAAEVERQMKAEAEQRRLETEANQAQAANQAKELELQQEESRKQLSQTAIFNSGLQRQQQEALKLEVAQETLKQQQVALKQLEKEKTELENKLKAEEKNALQRIALQTEELRRQSEQLQLELAQAAKQSPTERNCLSHTN